MNATEHAVDLTTLNLGAVEARALRLVAQLAEAPAPLAVEALCTDGESERQTRRALTFARSAGLAAPTGRSGCRATGPGRLAAARLRPRRGER